MELHPWLCGNCTAGHRIGTQLVGRRMLGGGRLSRGDCHVMIVSNRYRAETGYRTRRIHPLVSPEATSQLLLIHTHTHTIRGMHDDFALFGWYVCTSGQLDQP